MSFYSVKYACRFLLISFILSERAEKRKICPNAAGERRSIFRGQTGSKGGRKRQNKKVCTMFQTKRQPCRHEQKKRADEAKGKTAGRSDSENLCRLRRGKSFSSFVRRRAGGVSSARPSAACPFPARRTPCGKGGKFYFARAETRGLLFTDCPAAAFLQRRPPVFYIYNCRAGA